MANLHGTWWNNVFATDIIMYNLWLPYMHFDDTYVLTVLIHIWQLIMFVLWFDVM